MSLLPFHYWTVGLFGGKAENSWCSATPVYLLSKGSNKSTFLRWILRSYRRLLLIIAWHKFSYWLFLYIISNPSVGHTFWHFSCFFIIFYHYYNTFAVRVSYSLEVLMGNTPRFYHCSDRKTLRTKLINKQQNGNRDWRSETVTLSCEKALNIV